MAITKPTSYYKFQGNANDLIGSANGTLNGVTLTTGNIAYGYDYDGSNDYIDCGSDASLDLSTNDFAVSFNVKTTDTAGLMISKRNIASATTGFIFYISSNKVRFLLSNGTTNKFVTSTTTINDGNEHHIVGVRSGDNLYIYVDGAQEDTITGVGSHNIGTGQSLFFGFENGSSVPTNHLTGSMSEISIWNSYGISSTEVTELYNSGTGLTWSVGADDFIDETDLRFGLIGYWGLDSNANDHLGIYDGTVTGAVTATGLVGNGYDFSAGTDNIDLTSHGDIFPRVANTGTISIWFKTNSLATTQSLYFKSDSSSVTLLAGLFILTDGGLRYASKQIGSGNDAGKNTASGLISTGTWYNFVMTGDGTNTTKLYLNGVLLSTTANGEDSAERFFDLGNAWKIGTFWRSGTTAANGMDGILDEPMFSNRPLTPTQVLENYNSGVGKSYNPSLDLFIDGDSDSVTYRMIDDFDRADSSTLGVANNGNTWTEIETTSDFKISNNEFLYDYGSFSGNQKAIIEIQNNPDRIDFYGVRNVVTTGTNYILLDSNTDGVGEAILFATVSGNWKYYNGSAWTAMDTPQAVPTNVAQDISFRNINYSTYTFDIYFDDVKVTTGAIFRNNVDINYFQQTATDGRDFAISEISIGTPYVASPTPTGYVNKVIGIVSGKILGILAADISKVNGV